MASVFLSYDRDDATKARAIAAALEKAGHSVWWDRHIKGGSRYAAEIEKALREAEAVVVLWSRHSVLSDWVRDEAVKGRDSGRLVPARIDDAELPLGFGQHHTTDLSKWRGRTAAPQFRELIDAIESVGSDVGPVRSTTHSQPKIFRWGPLAFLSAAVVAAIIIGLSLWRPWGRGPAVPVVTIAAASQSAETRSLARDLLAKLGILQSTKGDALELVQGKSGRNSDLIFEVEAANNERSATANLVLLSGKDHSLLWSQEFEQSVGKQADLKQQVAFTAAKVLECAVDALSSKGERMRQEILKLHLNGCAGLTLEASDPETLLPILRRVTEEAPDFEGAWANLLRAEVSIYQSRNLKDPALRRRLLSAVTRARRVNPTLAEAFRAESWLLPKRPISGWMPSVEKAVESNPNHSGALLDRMENYLFLGRMQEALSDAGRAVQFDPLSPAARKALVAANTFAGRFETAEAELREAERLWPGTVSILSLRQLIDRRYGDARAALARLNSGEIGTWNLAADRSLLEARIDRSPAKVERALNEARAFFAREPASLTDLSQTLAEFGRMDELVQILLTTDPDQMLFVSVVLFRPQFDALRKDRRFMVIADRLGLVDYWRTSGKWPDFCAESDLPYDCKTEAAKLAAGST